MKITVEIAGWLKKYIHEKPCLELDIRQGLQAGEVIKMVGVPQAEIGFISVRNHQVDGERLVDVDYQVSEGDVLRFFSAIVGG